MTQRTWAASQADDYDKCNKDARAHYICNICGTGENGNAKCNLFNNENKN